MEDNDNKNEKNELSFKKIIIESFIALLLVIVLIVLSAINKKGIDILKPEYVQTITIITIIAIVFTPIAFKTIEDKRVANVAFQITDVFTMVTLAIVLVQVTFIFFVFPAQVVQTSMHPTLENEQMVLCKSNTNKIERFDIVVVSIDEELQKQTNNVLKSGELIVKRVIGLPGEKVKYTDGKLYINGELTSEEFITDDVFTKDTEEFILSDDAYLILGDHRSSSIINGENKPGSYDSREFGAVNKENIIGIVKYKMNSIFDWKNVK